MFLLLLGSKQYFGDPIECDTIQTGVDKQLFESYCWISSTWTVWEYYQPQMKHSKIVYPGIGVEKSGIQYTRLYHRYYQWIPAILAIYAVRICYVICHFSVRPHLVSHCSKSQFFVQKFNYDKTPTFSRVFHSNKN